MTEKKPLSPVDLGVMVIIVGVVLVYILASGSYLFTDKEFTPEVAELFFGVTDKLMGVVVFWLGTKLKMVAEKSVTQNNNTTVTEKQK